MEVLRRIIKELENPNIESLNMSMDDTHAKGVFSLVVLGTESGRLTRVFFADNKISPFDVQLHTHRYPITLTIIKGNISHHEALPHKGYIMPLYEYKSPLNGGSGLKYLQDREFFIRSNKMPLGSKMKLGINDFHTMSCSKGSIWIVEEHGFETDKSFVLGVPFITDGLYKKPSQFQINDKCQLLQKEIKLILNAID